MALNHTMFIPAPIERVTALLCSERYCLATQRAREDNVDASYEALDATDVETLFDVHVTSYGHKKTGKLDRSRTEKSVTHYRYDKATRILHWQHEGEHGSRVNVHGETKLASEGSRTRIDRVVTIDIRVPLIGRAITRLVEAGFRKSFVRMEQQIRDLLAEDA